MRTLSLSLALLLLGSSAYPQIKMSDADCRGNPADPGCPPPGRTQTVEPRDNPAYGLLSILLEPLALNPALAIGSEAWQESHKPLALDPTVRAQILGFIAARPDWEDHYPKMGEYAAKLRPGETTVFEYLLLLYRLAKMDVK